MVGDNDQISNESHSVTASSTSLGTNIESFIDRNIAADKILTKEVKSRSSSIDSLSHHPIESRLEEKNQVEKELNQSQNVSIKSTNHPHIEALLLQRKALSEKALYAETGDQKNEDMSFIPKTNKNLLKSGPSVLEKDTKIGPFDIVITDEELNAVANPDKSLTDKKKEKVRPDNEATTRKKSLDIKSEPKTKKNGNNDRKKVIEESKEDKTTNASSNINSRAIETPSLNNKKTINTIKVKVAKEKTKIDNVSDEVLQVVPSALVAVDEKSHPQVGSETKERGSSVTLNTDVPPILQSTILTVNTSYDKVDDSNKTTDTGENHYEDEGFESIIDYLSATPSNPISTTSSPRNFESSPVSEKIRNFNPNIKTEIAMQEEVICAMERISQKDGESSNSGVEEVGGSNKAVKVPSIRSSVSKLTSLETTTDVEVDDRTVNFSCVIVEEDSLVDKDHLEMLDERNSIDIKNNFVVDDSKLDEVSNISPLGFEVVDYDNKFSEKVDDYAIDFHNNDEGGFVNEPESKDTDRVQNNSLVGFEVDNRNLKSEIDDEYAVDFDGDDDVQAPVNESVSKNTEYLSGHRKSSFDKHDGIGVKVEIADDAIHDKNDDNDISMQNNNDKNINIATVGTQKEVDNEDYIDEFDLDLDEEINNNNNHNADKINPPAGQLAPPLQGEDVNGTVA